MRAKHQRTPNRRSIFVSYALCGQHARSSVAHQWWGNRVDHLRQFGARNAIGCLFILAMMIAPFIALIYGLGFGLLVLTVGLVFTAALAIDARGQAPPERRTVTLAMAVVALGLAVVTGVAAFSQLR